MLTACSYGAKHRPGDALLLIAARTVALSMEEQSHNQQAGRDSAPATRSLPGT
ncbi:MAG: hypothetical protein ACRDOK_17650 [Streptosporangiaceae bacterium]